MPRNPNLPLNGATFSRSFQLSDSAPCEFRDPTRAVPIGDENVSIGIDEAAVRRAEQVRLDVVRIEFVVSPLCRLRIITEERNRHIVPIKYRNATF